MLFNRFLALGVEKIYVGIDSCKAGWSSAVLKDDKITIHLFSSIQDLIDNLGVNIKAWIDIPIGLGSRNKPRDVDQLLRDQLPSFKQSVFNCPTRKAVYANTYLDSKKINQQETNKSLSIQSWFITPKIKDLDSFLINNPRLRTSFEEAHPEFCFFLLNNNTKLNNPKHTQKGIDERIKILERFQPNISNAYDSALKKYLRKDLKKDDIVDSLALLISLVHKKETKYIVSEHIADQKNITMRIVYPKLNL